MDGAGTPEGMTVGTGGSLSTGVAEGGGSAEGAADATAASLNADAAGNGFAAVGRAEAEGAAGARATAEAEGAAGAAAALDARTSPERSQSARAPVGVRVETRTRILSTDSAVIATNYGLGGAL
jgi:hypothetical protein